jgi:Phage integrase, N-terminal SAM-like domain
MIDDSNTLPAPIDTDRGRVSTFEQLASIPEQEIWLQKQKSPRTRRAYRHDVQHFMRTLAITTPAELRYADHKAVIAWERYMRETEHAAASTIRRRLGPVLSLQAPGPPRSRCAQSGWRSRAAGDQRWLAARHHDAPRDPGQFGHTRGDCVCQSVNV